MCQNHDNKNYEEITKKAEIVDSIDVSLFIGRFTRKNRSL